MSEPMELAPEVQALLSKARQGYVVSPQVRQAVFAETIKSAAPPAVAAALLAAATASGSKALGKTAVASWLGVKAGLVASTTGGLVVGIALGAGGHALVTQEHAAPSPSKSIQTAANQAPDRDATAPPAPSSSAPSPEVPPAPSPVSSPVSSAGDATRLKSHDWRDEKGLVDTARTAVARGDGAGALATLAERGRRFPKGRFGEEAEVLTIQALMQVGRRDEALQRAEQFRQRHPNSLLVPALPK